MSKRLYDDDDDALFSEPTNNPDAYPFSDDEEEEPQVFKSDLPLKASFHPVVRSDKHVQDSVCYYGQLALLTLLYAHVVEGEHVPGLFDREKQSMSVSLFSASKLFIYFRPNANVEFHF